MDGAMEVRDTKPISSARAKLYNPARDESADATPFASLWELLRRNPGFQNDAKLWVACWHERERLFNLWDKVCVCQRGTKEAQANEQQRIQLSHQLFALKHGSIPFMSWVPAPLDKPKQPVKILSLTPKQLGAARAWERADYVLCALSWMLPPVEWHQQTDDTERRRSFSGRPEEYRPELALAELKENQSYGPLRLDMAWPQTPPGFRKRFIREATPGWEGDKVELLDLHDLAVRLASIANRIPLAGSLYPPPTPKELEEAHHALNTIAIGELQLLHSRFKCFLIPDGRRYPRSHFKQVIAEIETHFEIFPDGLYPKASFFGRANQWEAYLTAESLPRKKGEFDYHETAKRIVLAQEQKSARQLKISRLASKMESDVKDCCKAINHWIRCVYPHLKPEPFVSRKGRKTVPETS
jgi:hypothetical protein